MLLASMCRSLSGTLVHVVAVVLVVASFLLQVQVWDRFMEGAEVEQLYRLYFHDNSWDCEGCTTPFNTMLHASA
jgi:uncharacterized membrane protein